MFLVTFRARLANKAVVGEFQHEHKMKIVAVQDRTAIDFEKIIEDWLAKNKKTLRLDEILDVQKLM